MLAGLPLGSTQETSDAMEPTNTGRATCVVCLVMVMLALALVFTMARGSRSRSDDQTLMEPEEGDGGRYGTVENPRIPEDEIARPRRARRLEVPPLREQLLRCLSACGEMFGTCLEGSHYERDATLRWRGSEATASARGSIDVTLHQLELHGNSCTST